MSYLHCPNLSDVINSCETPPNDLVEVGKIIDAYGVRGQLKIKIYNQNGDVLEHCRQWWLQNQKDSWIAVTPKQLKHHNDLLIVTLAGIQNREEAQSLRGQSIAVSRLNFPKLSNDEFYWVDLIGLSVSNLQSELFGNVVEMIDSGAHAVMRIQPIDQAMLAENGISSVKLPHIQSKLTNGKEDILVPFVAAYVIKVDLKAKAITVDWQKDYL